MMRCLINKEDTKCCTFRPKPLDSSPSMTVYSKWSCIYQFIHHRKRINAEKYLPRITHFPADNAVAGDFSLFAPRTCLTAPLSVIYPIK